MAPGGDVNGAGHDAPPILAYATPMPADERAGAVGWAAATLVWLVTAGLVLGGLSLVRISLRERGVELLAIGLTMVAFGIFEAVATWQSVWRRSAAWATVVAVSSGLIAVISLAGMMSSVAVGLREPFVFIIIAAIYVGLPAFVAAVHARWAIRLRRAVMPRS